MKTSVMLMAGILAVALAGSAQAATMFAVQNAGGTQDMATISDTGEIAGAKVSIGLNATNVPNFNVNTVAQGNLHAATQGNGFANAAMLLQHATTLNASAKYATSAAPNFSFYRINKDQNTGLYSLPQATAANANATLGFLNFGTLDTTQDPNAGLYRRNLVTILANAEFSATNPTAWGTLITNTPAYISFYTTSNATTAGTPASNVYKERMRLSADGNLGINTGTATPSTKLQVVGLPYYPTNTAAVAAGLTAGAFYMCGGNGVSAYVSGVDTPSQSLCVAY